MAEDHIHFDATFATFDAEVRRAREVLEEQLAKAEALGDKALESRIRGQLASPALGGQASAAEVEKTTAALEREGKALAHNAQLNLFNLELLQKQAEYEARVAARREEMGGGQLSFPREPLVVTPAGIAPTQEQVALQRHLDELAAAEGAGRQEVLRIQQEQLAADEARLRVLEEQRLAAKQQEEMAARGYAAGQAAARAGVPLTSAQKTAIAPEGAGLSKAQRDMVLYNAELGKYDTYARKASVSTERLQANVTRLGIADAEASNQLRRHGALTTEFLSALARGETTVNEFGYQIGATIGKFAGWTAAAGATYSALGAVVEFGKGAIDTASGVQQLTRTIDNLDREKASQAIINLSSDVNVPVKEASDAIFAYSRTFHNLNDATTAARLGLAAFKLDNVDMASSVRASTAIHQQFGVTASGLTTVYNELSAGQREYNARISEMIPLLQKATGAVHNAGGQLDPLVQLGIYAQRITQLSGAQIGTAFYRSAATFLSPNTTKGLADRDVLKGFGIDPNQGWTTILHDALVKSLTLSSSERAKLSNAIFGPQYGGRLSAIFSPQGIPTYQQITQRITPQSTQGSLQTELDRQLGTARERMHSFINEIQRTGAAIADSGLVNFFSAFLLVLVTVGHGVRDVIQVFDGLPSAVKDTVTALVLLRATMLFLNRTRFGSSFGGLSQIARIPGIDPSYEAQKARAQLATGTRAAMQVVEDDIAKATAASLTNGARQLTLGEQRAAIQRQIAAGEGNTAALVAESNAVDEKIAALKRQQITIEGEKVASQKALSTLEAEQVALTTSNRNKRLGDAGVTAKSAEASSTAAVASEESAAAATADTAAQERLAAWRVRNGGALILDAEAIRAQAAATTEEIAATEAVTAASTEAAAVTEGEVGRLAAMRASLGGLAAAMDPLTIALVGLPFIYSAIKSAFDNADNAAKAASTAAKEPANTIAALQQKASDLAKAAANQKNTNVTSNLPGPFGDIENFVLKKGQELLGTYQDSSPTSTAAQRAQTAANLYAPLLEQARRDGERLKATEAGRQQWLRELARLRAEAGSPVSRGPSLDVFKAINLNVKGTLKEVLGAIDHLKINAPATPEQAFLNSLKQIQNQIEAQIAKTGKAKDFLSTLDALTAKQIEELVQGYSNRANVYGLSGGDLQKAGEAYLFLAARYRNSTDQKGLQLVQTAQSAFISAVNKNVQDLLKASQSATTYGAEQGDLQHAVSTIQNTKRQVQQWVAAMDKKFRKYPSIIRAISQAAQQIDAQLNDQLKSALDQQIQLIEQNASLRAAEITGVSPEADIARAEATLSGLREALAKARAEGADWQTLAGLITQIDTSMNEIAKQKIANARSILEAQGQLATSAITGTSSAADIARAQSDLNNAIHILAFDRRNGAGTAQILQDQTAVNNAQRTLAEQIQQRDQQLAQDLQAFIQSEADLAKAQTSDPVKQAREQLDADIRLLATIKPSDYKTTQEYETALNEARAKIASDRFALEDQIVQTDLRNLAFEHDIHRIGDTQYLDGLRRILRNKKLTTEERQQILEQIYSLTHQGNNLDLNVGNIKIPSIYEIRRAIGLGRHGELPGAVNTVINHRANVIVYVTGRKGAAAVGQVLDDHLNTSVRSAMRAAGVI